MNDINGPDYASLYALASAQAGYFTTAQARERGVSRRALAHHTDRGRFQRVRRGLYRFRDYPSSAYEEVVMAWLAIGADRSVISHDTALDIYDLTDIIPLSVHLIVPRAQRGLHPPTGVTLHTTVQPLRDDEVTTREGVRLTAPERALLDVAEAGTAPEQVERGIQATVERGWVQPGQILFLACRTVSETTTRRMGRPARSEAAQEIAGHAEGDCAMIILILPPALRARWARPAISGHGRDALKGRHISMYIPPSNQITDRAVLHDLMQRFSFATLVTQHDSRPFATHLPFLVDPDRGEQGRLLAHLARANPQWTDFAPGVEALAIFQGPHTYISPSWYTTQPSVPTWNYAVVHAYGTPRVIDDEEQIAAVLRRLVATHEDGLEEPWSVEQVPADYFEKMARGIVTFEMPIARLEGKLKLSQNRSLADRRRVIEALGQRAEDGARGVQALMQATLPPRDKQMGSSTRNVARGSGGPMSVTKVSRT